MYMKRRERIVIASLWRLMLRKPDSAAKYLGLINVLKETFDWCFAEDKCWYKYAALVCDQRLSHYGLYYLIMPQPILDPALPEG
jgi:hypothetical protein